MEQLAVGGIMVLPVGERWRQELLMVTKREGKPEIKNLGGCVFVPLIGKHGFS